MPTFIPWIEKYRPQQLSDMVMNQQLRRKLLNLISLKTIPNIIITGPTGTGKTTTLYCFAKSFINNPEYLLELNASDNRGMEYISTSITHFCKKKSDSKKMIIFDEADNITNKAQHLLINLIDQYNYNTIFTFTCNESNKIIESIQNRCLMLYFSPICNENIIERLKYLCISENIEYDMQGLSAISYISNGDIRYAINNLEATYYCYTKIIDVNVYNLCYQPNPIFISNIIEACINKDIKLVINLYKSLKEQGYCNSDILQSMINILKNMKGISEALKLKYIKCISDIYLYVVDGIDSDLLMYSYLSKLILINNT